METKTHWQTLPIYLSLHVWTEVAALHLTLETIEVALHWRAPAQPRPDVERGRGGGRGSSVQAPAGLIRETVTNVTAIDTWRPYHALHTARCPNNLQLSCGYPAWLAFQVTTNVMTYHSWQQNCFEHLHWIVKLPASILVTVWAATQELQTAADIVTVFSMIGTLWCVQTRATLLPRKRNCSSLAVSD